LGVTIAAAIATGCTATGNNTGGGGCISNMTYTTAKALGVNDDNTADGPTTASTTNLAQSFLVPSTGSNLTIGSVTLFLFFKGTLPAGGNLTATIVPDNGGVPGSTPVTGGTSNLVPYTSVPNGTPGAVVFTFSSPPVLSVGSTYWITLAAQYANSAVNVVLWAADDISVDPSAFTGGKALWQIGGVSGPYTTSGIGSGREFGFSLACQ
jgi:hypothetical protein